MNQKNRQMITCKFQECSEFVDIPGTHCSKHSYLVEQPESGQEIRYTNPDMIDCPSGIKHSKTTICDFCKQNLEKICKCHCHYAYSPYKEEGIEWYDHYFDTDRDLYFKIRDSIRDAYKDGVKSIKGTFEQVAEEARREVAEEVLEIVKNVKEGMGYMDTTDTTNYMAEQIESKIEDKYLSRKGGTE